MARRKYGFDEAKIARFEKEERGKGEGASYLPWLTVQDVPSLGLRTRIRSRIGRLHHLLSNIETSVFLLLHWQDLIVVDIREQFPLSRDQTREVAKEIGVDHPRDPHTGTDLVMTVDLLAFVATDGAVRSVPISCKPVSELAKKRTVEKLEIERRVCLDLWSDWRLMTERDYPRQRVQNLDWMHEYRTFEHIEAPHASYWQDCCDHVVRTLRQSPGMTIGSALATAESRHGMQAGHALSAYRHLLANKVLAMDLDAPYRSDAPVSSVTLVDYGKHKRSAA